MNLRLAFEASCVYDREERKIIKTFDPGEEEQCDRMVDVLNAEHELLLASGVN